MGWLTTVDGYCERLGSGYWAEPVNALSNLAFILAAVVMWRRCASLPLARAMVIVLAVIGVGSYLFHTHANQLTSLLDVTPIVGFILLYVFAASKDLLGLKPWQSAASALAFLPYAALTVPLWAMVPGLGSSAGYAPVPVLILLYALILRSQAPDTARGLAIGAGLLVVSLTFRTLDGPFCIANPIGLHFIWHILNAVMLAWMIEVYRRHMLAKAS